MPIIPLTAQDALSASVINVSAEMRLKDLSRAQATVKGYEAYAVFVDLEEIQHQAFLGMVSNQAVVQYPHRIFGDLLSLSKSTSVIPSAPLDTLYSDFQENGFEAFSVMESGSQFLGAVTLTSLLKALWQREQFLSARLQQEINNTKNAKHQLHQAQHALQDHLNQGADHFLEYQQQINLLSESLKSTEKRERQTLAMELHDHLAQILTVCQMKLSQGIPLVHHSGLLDLLHTVDGLLHESLSYIRTLMTELNSAQLHQFGMRKALETLVEKMKQFNLQVALEIEQPIPDLSEDQQFHIYWSLRELLFNVIKHAQVQQATLVIHQVRDNQLECNVSDGGSGFDPDIIDLHNGQIGHFGLSGIRGRTAALQGTFSIHSSPGKGTRAILTVPLPLQSSPNKLSF